MRMKGWWERRIDRERGNQTNLEREREIYRETDCLINREENLKQIFFFMIFKSKIRASRKGDWKTLS